MKQSLVLRTLVFALTILHLTAGSSPLQGQILKEVSRGAANQWQITWTSKLGVEYTVQRSIDLQNWIDIGTVTANGTESVFVDTEAPATVRNFWRLRYDDGGVGVLTPFSIIEVARVDAQGNVLPPNSSEGNWRISWESEAGVSYTVQRSADGLSWTDLATITATAEITRYVDSTAPSVPRLLWRVMAMTTTGGGVEISKILPQLSSPGGGSAASLGVMINSNTPVVSVQFYNGGTLLGSGSPGLGNIWSFPLSWDPDAPEVIQLVLQVNLQDGEPVRTDPVGVLRADPSKFAPLTFSTEKAPADGVPNFGSLVGADSSGVLDAFAYYPEGVGEREGSTGAHFRFAAGATIGNQGIGSSITFSEGNFYRGSLDPDPLPARAGTHDLVLSTIDASAVTSSFAVPAGEPLRLLWGETQVIWNGGALGDEGWQALFVTPQIGSFALPGFQANAEFRIDPKTGEPNLIACFSGAWEPFPDSATSFRVPASDPLKIYLPSRGTLSASGTVELVFPDGAAVRGSLSWRDPNLEIRIEGRGFTIPAIGFLRDQLPIDPAACLPAGQSDAELDAAAACLASYRNAYRNVATGGLQQSAIDGDSLYAPPASPDDSAGAALEGWAWRIASWNVDRPGETLSAEASAQLIATIAGAGRTAEAARDLPTALKLLRDFLKIRNGFADVMAPAAEIPLDFLAKNEARFYRSAERILAQKATLDTIDEIPLIASLLGEGLKENPPPNGGGQGPGDEGGNGGGPPAANPWESMLKLVRQAIKEDLQAMGTGDPTAVDPHNPALESQTPKQLLALLRSARAILALIESEGLRLARADLDADGCPQLNVEALQAIFPDFFPSLLDAILELRFVLTEKLSLQGELALAPIDQIPPSYDAFQRLRAAADNYAEFFALNRAILLPLAQNHLEPSAEDLIIKFVPAALYWDTRTDPDFRGSSAVTNLRIARDIALSTREACRDGLASQIDNLRNMHNVLRFQVDTIAKELLGDFQCDRWRLALNALIDEDISVLPSSVAANENITNSIRLTGQFASGNSLQEKLKTLQISQAGSYFEGYLQTHHPGHDLQGDFLRGLLISSGPNELKFGYLRLDANNPEIIQGSGILTASEFDENVGGQIFRRLALTLTETQSFPGGGAPPNGNFIRIGRQAPLSDRLLGLLSGDAAKVLRAQQRAPLHPFVLDEIRDLVFGTPDGPAAPPDTLWLTDLIENAINANSFNRPSQAQLVEDRIAKMFAAVSTDHVPLLRSLLNEHLTKESVPGTNGEITYWRRLLELFVDQISRSDPQKPVILMPKSGELLGATSANTASGLDPTKLYHYEFTIAKLEFGVPALAGLGTSVSALEIDVRKWGPGIPPDPDNPWVFAAISGQVGKSWSRAIDRQLFKEIFDVLPGVSVIQVEATSFFDYSIEDIAGGFAVLEASAGIGTELGGVGPSISSFEIFPEGNKPSLIIDLGKAHNSFGPDSTLTVAKASVGLSFALGWIFPVTGQELQNLKSHGLADARIEGENEADFALQVSFMPGSDELSPCGWQSLREWVAEFRNLLEEEGADITVLGFTDTKESNTTVGGLDLSERRAQTVKDAVSILLGLGVNPPEFRIIALGLGPRAALNTVTDLDIAAEIGPQSPRITAAILAQRAGRTIPPETGSPYWHQTLIVVNDIVALRLHGEIGGEN